MESTLQFRAADLADLAQLVAMLADDALGAQREDPSQPLNAAYERNFRSIDTDPNNLLVVAERGDEIVGMMQLTFIPYLTHTGSWRCLVEGVRVAAAHRGRGLGKALLQYAIAQARERGCRLVQLTSDKRRSQALDFYRDLGFEATHEGFKLPL